MRVLVCGGRDFGNFPTDENGFIDRQHPTYLDKHREYFYVKGCLNIFAAANSKHYSADNNWLPSDIKIISGAATGADFAAIEWGNVHRCEVHEYPADWKKYGKSAGYIRNKHMLIEGRPDVVLAFPGGRGTEHMISEAQKHGVKVIKFDYKV